jgi:hypothetical protein
MALGLSTTLANSILNHLRGGATWTAPSGLYVKLHTGDPGSAATANAAGNTTRQQATVGSAASGGTLSNSAQIQWTSVSTAETYSHLSIWDASSGGNFLWSGAFTSGVAVSVGATFTIATGDLDFTFSLAA